MNFPMVCPPAAWKVSNLKEKTTLARGRAPCVSDNQGGYITSRTAELALLYCLLTSSYYDHFYAYVNSIYHYKEMTSIITEMQYVPFVVNVWLLRTENT
jgi:hypothetical protein